MQTFFPYCSGQIEEAKQGNDCNQFPLISQVLDRVINSVTPPGMWQCFGVGLPCRPSFPSSPHPRSQRINVGLFSLRRGHANLLCIVPILVYVLPKRARDCFQLPDYAFRNQKNKLRISNENSLMSLKSHISQSDQWATARAPRKLCTLRCLWCPTTLLPTKKLLLLQEGK